MKTKRNTSNFFNWSYFLIFIILLVLINIIASFLYFRYDATEDKRFSLADGTINYLKNDKNFKDRLLFKIYLEGNLPSEVRRFRNSIEDKLKEFKEYAGKRIEFQFIDPMEGSEQDRISLFENIYQKGKGIVPMELLYNKDGSQTQMMLWPGAVIEYLGRTVNYVQLIPGTPQGKYYQLNEGFEQQIQNSINNLEYILISAIRRSTQSKKDKIAFLKGHGELTFAQTQRVRTLISPYYNIEDIQLNDSLDALNGFKGLIIARPTLAFSEKDKYIIDQFLMKGGRLMCFIDKLQLNNDSLKAKGVTYTMRYPLELDKMLFDYGIKINDNYVIDVRCAPMAIPSSKQPLMPWFFDVVTTPTSHPISRNIEPVVLRYVSEIQFVGNSNRVSQPILTSSNNSAMTGLAPLVSLSLPLTYGPKPILVQNPEDDKNRLCLAGLVEGFFESHFKNRLVDAFAKNPHSRFKDKSIAEGKVFVIGNGRFIENKYDSILDKNGKWNYRPKAFNDLRFDETMSNIPGMQPLVYGNQEFFQNLVDYMMGDRSVLDIRSKQIDIHALDKDKIKNNSSFYKIINMSIPSILIIILALSIYSYRRRKYIRK